MSQGYVELEILKTLLQESITVKVCIWNDPFKYAIDVHLWNDHLLPLFHKYRFIPVYYI